MPRWTASQIAEAFRNSNLTVQGPAGTMSGGRPGVFYILTREPSNNDLARITHQSGDREINLMRLNDAFLVTVHGHNHGTPQFPRRADGIQEVHWLAHTHPLEHGNQEGPTPTDWDSIERFYALAGRPSRGVESRVVACRGGRVVSVAPLHHRPWRRPSLESLRTPF